MRDHRLAVSSGQVSHNPKHNPNFVAYAKAFGGHGEHIHTAEDCGPALQRAMASGLPSLLYCRIDPEAITPNSTLELIRARALERASAAAQGPQTS
ncbi:thiamine pyrophosphate-dependent enzyme [Simplicispira suum]|uniref:thiamine pyrophosphate-dependent enzyme n=1 Tax=Simplicispira suum TaxID=2109915 RepID=UPI0011B215E8